MIFLDKNDFNFYSESSEEDQESFEGLIKIRLTKETIRQHFKNLKLALFCVKRLQTNLFSQAN